MTRLILFNTSTMQMGVSMLSTRNGLSILSQVLVTHRISTEELLRELGKVTRVMMRSGELIELMVSSISSEAMETMKSTPLTSQ